MSGAGCQIGNERIEPGKSRCTTRRKKKDMNYLYFKEREKIKGVVIPLKCNTCSHQ